MVRRWLLVIGLLTCTLSARQSSAGAYRPVPPAARHMEIRWRPKVFVYSKQLFAIPTVTTALESFKYNNFINSKWIWPNLVTFYWLIASLIRN
jgi:hypothetical protein